MADAPQYDYAALVGRDMTAEQIRLLLAAARDLLQSLGEGEFTRQSLDRGLRAIAENKGIDPTHLFRPLRVAVQGNIGTPGLYETIMSLGKEPTLNLLNTAIRSLGVFANAK
jgi:glutamyl/glutaminyl-tRNA synthetase